ncbi:MAG: hypothetical protein QOH73_18 [Gaiellaceae bacterium]|nr:hypothetical protein [Gaiellaceae bacterium]
MLHQSALDQAVHLLEEVVIETTPEVRARHAERARQPGKVLLGRRAEGAEHLEIGVIVRRRNEHDATAVSMSSA